MKNYYELTMLLKSVVLLALVYITSVKSDSAERQLFNDLFENYTVMERPVKNHEDALRIDLKLLLHQIVDIDEKNQIMTTNAWLDMKWKNEILTWDPQQYNNLTATRIPYDKIWVPDILLYNSASDKFDSTTHTSVVINHNGSCLLVPPGYFLSTCEIDVTNFPFDKQKCKLKFGVWTYNRDQVDLQLQEGGGIDTTESYIANGEWHLEAMTAKRTELTYKCCATRYVDITFEIVLQRRSMFYMINLVIPCVLNSLLTLLTFLLPADAAEKVTLSITVLLAQIVFMLLVMEAMPSTSDAVPLISKYFTFSLAYVCASVGATILVLSFHYHIPDMGGQMSPRMRKFFLEFLPFILHQKKDRYGSYIRAKNQNIKLHCVCPTSFGLESEKQAASLNFPNDYIMLHGLHHHLGFIAHKMANEDRNELQKLEWQFAARMMDKFFLWFFSILVFIATLITLFAIPAIANHF